MRTIAIVQARVGSTRLPAKVLLDLGGRTALERCLERVSRIRAVSDVVVATSTKPEDDLVAALAKRLGYSTFRGSELDVLSRYRGAADFFSADVIVRCTSDCPLLDPEASSLVVEGVSSEYDYASNCLERRLPRGLDTEAFTREALERTHGDAITASEREHVTLHMYRHPEAFRLRSCLPEPAPTLEHHRWTLDTLEDYRMLAALFDLLGSSAATASMEQVARLLEEHPEVFEINSGITQKQG